MLPLAQRQRAPGATREAAAQMLSGAYLDLLASSSCGIAVAR